MKTAGESRTAVPAIHGFPLQRACRAAPVIPATQGSKSLRRNDLRDAFLHHAQLDPTEHGSQGDRCLHDPSKFGSSNLAV